MTAKGVEKPDSDAEISLTQASRARNYKKLVKLEAVVTGKAVLPYQIPKIIQTVCRPKKCKNCSLKDLVDDNGHAKIHLELSNPNLIKFINTAETNFSGIIKHMYNIDNRCDYKFQILEVYTVEEVYLSEVQTQRATNPVMRVGYVINRSLESNIPYRLNCYAVPDPKTQKLAHMIVGAKKLKMDIDDFHLSESDLKALSVFSKHNPSPDSEDQDVEQVFDFLNNLYNIYSSNLTRIYKRFDLHMAIDLVFHSPLQFYFNREFIHKGWLDVMVIGDTRCGKGYVSENLIRYYGVGDIVSGENVSFAGLVGGVQQLSGRWVITWGKIPLNNKRLVVIDESGEMDPRDMSRLSRIRSEGVAEITKIQTERTDAKARLIFLTNPKNRMVSSYSFGIESILDLVENAEDISRFDYVLVVAQSEVDIHEMNQTRKTLDNPYQNVDSKLVQWIWSRTPEQIKFLPETTKMILDRAIKFGSTYSPKIPLIQGENIRVKLAKISAAIAGRLFSHDGTGEILVVHPAHVQAACIFLNLIYKKQASGYYYLSQIHKQSAFIHELKEFEKYINSFENRYDLVNYFVQNNYITVTDLSECVNQPKEIVRDIISKMIHHKCIQKKYSFYVKNQCFTEWLRNNA